MQSTARNVVGADTLKDIKPSDLSPNEAIRLLELGLEQERRALGIPNVTRPEHQPKVTNLATSGQLYAGAVEKAAIIAAYFGARIQTCPAQ